jgi:hypothetical protein
MKVKLLKPNKLSIMKANAVLLVLAFMFGMNINDGFSQKKDINGVTSIEVNIACQLVIVQGNKPNIEIVGDKRLVDNIIVEINGDKLKLYNEVDYKRMRKEDVVVKIEVADLKRLDIGGAVDMKTVKTLELDNFKLSITGVGNVEMGLVADYFKLNCSGVGNIEIEGKCNSMKMSVSGVGNINATEFKAKNADVNNSGVGKVNVFVTDDLNATVSGVGSVKYIGTPLINANVSGLGRISQY